MKFRIVMTLALLAVLGIVALVVENNKPNPDSPKDNGIVLQQH